MSSSLKFDYENLYSSNNVNIIETLLDKKETNFDEIIEIFASDENSKKTLSSYLKKLDIEKYRAENNLEQTENNFVCSDKMLVTLVRGEILTLEICRLPRLIKNSEQFNDTDIIPDRYEEEYNNLVANKNITKELIDTIIKASSNFINKSPVTLTHDEAKRKLEKNDLPESLLKIALEEGKIGAYLNIEQQYVFTASVSKYATQSIGYFCKLNCGNPHYKTRYPNLEKLTVKTIKELYSRSKVHIKTEIQGYLPVETTDFETKFHLEREINSFNDRNVINLKDIIYLQEDINMIINEKTCINDSHKNLKIQPDITSDKSQKRKSPITTIKLNKLVSYFINETEHDSYYKFYNLMTNDYLYKGKGKPNNEETYNEFYEVGRVYTIYSKEKNKYLVYFSFKNEAGEYIAKKPYAIESFKARFRAVGNQIK